MIDSEARVRIIDDTLVLGSLFMLYEMLMQNWGKNREWVQLGENWIS